ncbi:hypothetical protein FisN_3Lh591 [Fistulifera solaris]|uniref:Anamorsin C-terminal domain-containing protein n=1 Tax=Fistulifera solaris TaxID=1519565 RepID=A0A1Z5J8S3_FISSO|nr:hypothetical protein FisN_3Lh591 [Fistulifera solaris]|eukprot:GAX10375.1 hypothetical protein FisN_3Lh591 [Fistulifera solaris]
MTAATTRSCTSIVLGNATIPSSLDESSLSTVCRVALWTDAQPPQDGTNLDIYVKADEFATVWNSPMHLSSFSTFSHVQIHVQGNFTPDIASTLQTSLLLAGLVATGERKATDTVTVQAQKRAPDVRMQAKPLWTTTTTPPVLDENSLLESDLLAPPPALSAVATKGDDCGGREPCADCTCGRKDGNVLLEQQPQAVPASSCGKCGLGDAFRCASCPYLGKPAFKAGEEHLVLDLQDDL